MLYIRVSVKHKINNVNISKMNMITTIWESKQNHLKLLPCCISGLLFLFSTLKYYYLIHRRWQSWSNRWSSNGQQRIINNTIINNIRCEYDCLHSELCKRQRGHRQRFVRRANWNLVRFGNTADARYRIARSDSCEASITAGDANRANTRHALPVWYYCTSEWTTHAERNGDERGMDCFVPLCNYSSYALR